MLLGTLVLQSSSSSKKALIKLLKNFIAPNFPGLHCFPTLLESICKEKCHRTHLRKKKCFGVTWVKKRKH